MNLWAAEVDRMLEEQENFKKQDTSAYIASRVANFVECLTTSADKVKYSAGCNNHSTA